MKRASRVDDTGATIAPVKRASRVDDTGATFTIVTGALGTAGRQ